MDLRTFAEFTATALAAGLDEVLERNWAPGQMSDLHRHDFDVQSIVARGEMWLIGHPQAAQHLRPGQRFGLAAHFEHAERYGPEGATYWVARRAARS